MRQIVVLGSSGFVGSEVARVLKGGYSILGVDRIKGEETQYICSAELIDQNWWQTNTQKDAAIIFAVGKADVRGSLLDPASDYNAYVLPLSRVLNLLKPAQRIVLISSAAVYSGLECPQNGYREDLELKSSSVYGWHRILAEFLVSERMKGGGFAGYDIIRPFSLFGAGLKRQVIYDFARRLMEAREGAILQVYGTGQELRDFVHVEAVPRLIEALLNRAPSNISFNLCSGSPISIVELTRRIRAELGRVSEVQFDGQNIPPPQLVGNPTRVKSLINFDSTLIDRRLAGVLRCIEGGS